MDRFIVLCASVSSCLFSFSHWQRGLWSELLNSILPFLYLAVWTPLPPIITIFIQSNGVSVTQAASQAVNLRKWFIFPWHQVGTSQANFLRIKWDMCITLGQWSVERRSCPLWCFLILQPHGVWTGNGERLKSQSCSAELCWNARHVASPCLNWTLREMFADLIGPIHYIKVLANDKLNLQDTHTTAHYSPSALLHKH